MADRFVPPQEPEYVPNYSAGPSLSDFPFIFIIATFLLMFMFLFLMPLVLTINTSFWQGGEGILQDALATTGGISDAGVKNSILGVFSGTADMFVTGQQIIGFFSQWGWLFVVTISIVIMLLLARRQVETGMV
jgi:hypothetical protein